MPESAFDPDPLLDSLLEDLRATMVALNDGYHPVYPAGRHRLAELERRRDELRQAIVERKRQLATVRGG